MVCTQSKTPAKARQKKMSRRPINRDQSSSCLPAARGDHEGHGLTPFRYAVIDLEHLNDGH